MTGRPSSNTPASMWTLCESYTAGFHAGIVIYVSGTYGSATKELVTVVSPLTASSHTQLFELFNELQDLWPLVPISSRAE